MTAVRLGHTATLNLTSSSSPATVGTNITFTASLSTSGRDSTGTVVFNADGNPTPVSTVVVSDGSATYSTSDLTIGTHTITATYSGGAGLLTTSANLTQNVTPNPVAASITNTILPQAAN